MAGESGRQRAGDSPNDDELLAHLGRLEPPPFAWATRLPEAVAVVAVLVIGLALVLILTEDDGSTLPGAGQPSSMPGAAPSPTAPPRSAPAGPGPDPELVDPDITLGFEGDLATLPPPAEGLEWRYVAGELSVVSGQARSAPAGPLGALAVFESPTLDLRAQVTLPEANPATGMVFRGNDQQWWAWVVAPAFSTVNLYRVTAGEQTLVLNSGVTVVEAGMTLGVNLTGPRAELLVNGAVVQTVDFVGSGRQVGLAALNPEVTGVFDDLVIDLA